MKSRHRSPDPGDTRQPLPYPNGWFAVCLSDELKPGAVLTVPFAGQELLVYRTRSGRACIAEPYCPHLGAHLGHGGRIDGEDIVCPFHGLAFAPDGHCVRTGNGQKPPFATLSHQHTCEVNGAVFTWRDSSGQPPNFALPEFGFEGFSRPHSSSAEPTGYVQDMVENTADVAHFPVLHGFTDTAVTHHADGCRITFELSGRWHGVAVTMCFTSHGLGYTEGEINIPNLAVRVRTQSFATPLAPLRWKFRWSDALRIPRLDALPVALRAVIYAALSGAAHRWFARVARADFEIWNHRQYLEHPKLVAGETSVAALRRWSKQFYPVAELAVNDRATSIVLGRTTHLPEEPEERGISTLVTNK
ncbi:Rieske 2Fe-2S domain-containing protein [Burkholderia pyrrocinia]